MLTKDFKYLTFPFEEFNPPQAKAISFVENDCNMIAALNTSTGKTAIAMAFFGHELMTKKETKCIYASPLKAISEERIEDFNNVFEWNNYKKTINTGDHFAKPEDFEDSRLIVVTSETLDSKSRNENLHGSWLKKVGVLVVDEIHMLNESNRGAALEMALVNFSKINQNARIIGLSATMSNASEIAKWLKNLNKKQTFVVSSDWRPVSLKFYWMAVEESKDRWSTEEEMIMRAADVVDSNKDEKILLFVHSKRIGEALTSEINARGNQCYFYNAGLKRDKKMFLEQMFKNSISGLNALVTTSALAMGVNL